MAYSTFASIKRSFKVGTKFETIYHKEFAGRDENGNVLYKDKNMGVREVSIVQSNAVAFKNEATGRDSWLQYPKASDVKVIDDRTFQVYEDGDLILTYKLVSE